MAYVFGDGFDLYATMNDPFSGYWDTGSGAQNQFVVGRFGGQAISFYNNPIAAAFVKNSGANDAVHHIVCAFRQPGALSGTTIESFFQLSDAATNQVCIAFRSDGAILLTSATPGGAVLDTYIGAVTAANVWFAFEFEIVINNTTGSWAVRKNGNTSNDRALGSLNTRPGTNAYANRLTLGTSSGAAPAVQQFDDLLWRSDAASVPFVGDIRCYTRMPSVDISTQFSKFPTTNTFYFSQSSSASSGPVANTIWWYCIQSTYAGNIISLNANFGAAVTGHVNMAVYDATGASIGGTNSGAMATPGPGPGALLGTATPLTNPGLGIQTFTLVTPAAVAKNQFIWIAMIADTSLAVAINGASIGSCPSLSFTYSGGAFPSTGSGFVMTGNHSGFTYIGATMTPSNANLVSETLQDGTTTYVYDTVPGHADFYTTAPLPTVPSSTVAVTTRGFVQKGDAGTRIATVQLKSGVITAAAPAAVLATSFGWLWRTDTTIPGNTSNPVLLVHCDGTNGSTAFIDASPSAHTLTATGTAAISTGTTKFGTGSANFTLGSSPGIASNTPVDFNFGAGQFTVEAWLYFTAGLSSPSTQAIVSQWHSSVGNLGWFFGFNAPSTLFFRYSTTGSNGINGPVYASFTPTLNQWYHFAVDCDASDMMRIYINGAIVASMTVTDTIFASTLNCIIGNDNSNADYPNAFIDEVRVTKGAALYAGPFTPASAPFTLASSSWTAAAVDAAQIGPLVVS